MTEALTPILKWLCEEQTNIAGKDLASIAGISPQTWSKVRLGKQDLSSDLLWRIMKAIAAQRPYSEVATVINLIEGKKKSQLPVSNQLEDLISVASESDLEAAMLLIVKRIFPEKPNKFNKELIGTVRTR